MNEAPSICHYTDLSDALRLPPVVSRLVEFFDSRDSVAYIVGGAVRDAVMGRDSEDLDVALSGDAYLAGREIAEAFGGRCAPLNDERQVARVALHDADWSGYVDVAAIQGCGIEQDLRRRDFTINAMAAPLAVAPSSDVKSRLLDPCGGLRDLRRGVVRMVSPEALDEDPVRLMRGARLATQFGFSLDRGTADAIRGRASRIGCVAQERVRDELMRLLQCPNAYEGVRLLDELGLLCAVMPELAQAKGVAQPKEHYWDVFTHLVEAVGWVDEMFKGKGNGKGDDGYPLRLVPRFEEMREHLGEVVSDGFDRLTYLKLAALLHDIAKPATKTVEASGRIRFLGHHVDGAELARIILRRLRFGSKGVEHVAMMVRHHLRPRQMAQKGEMPSRRALYRYYRDVGDVALDTLYLNTADYLAARGPMLEREDWTRHCALMEYIFEAGSGEKSGESEDLVKSLPKLVDGYDIIDRFALAPGPLIGELLEGVREAQASGYVRTREQALELVRAGIERGGDGA